MPPFNFLEPSCNPNQPCAAISPDRSSIPSTRYPCSSRCLPRRLHSIPHVSRQLARTQFHPEQTLPAAISTVHSSGVPPSTPCHALTAATPTGSTPSDLPPACLPPSPAKASHHRSARTNVCCYQRPPLQVPTKGFCSPAARRRLDIIDPPHVWDSLG